MEKLSSVFLFSNGLASLQSIQIASFLLSTTAVCGELRRKICWPGNFCKGLQTTKSCPSEQSTTRAPEMQHRQPQPAHFRPTKTPRLILFVHFWPPACALRGTKAPTWPGPGGTRSGTHKLPKVVAVVTDPQVQQYYT